MITGFEFVFFFQREECAESLHVWSGSLSQKVLLSDFVHNFFISCNCIV